MNRDPKFPYLAHCFRCERPISSTARSEEPVMCGQCHSDVGRAAATKAVQAAYARARAESEARA